MNSPRFSFLAQEANSFSFLESLYSVGKFACDEGEGIRHLCNHNAHAKSPGIPLSALHILKGSFFHPGPWLLCCRSADLGVRVSPWPSSTCNPSLLGLHLQPSGIHHPLLPFRDQTCFYFHLWNLPVQRSEWRMLSNPSLFLKSIAVSRSKESADQHWGKNKRKLLTLLRASLSPHWGWRVGGHFQGAEPGNNSGGWSS